MTIDIKQHREMTFDIKQHGEMTIDIKQHGEMTIDIKQHGETTFNIRIRNTGKPKEYQWVLSTLGIDIISDIYIYIYLPNINTLI